MPLGLAVFLIAWLLPELASANPGFARKYGFSCIMCHAGFPKLNSFGETFAGNGFQMPGGNVTVSAVKMGDAKLFLEKNINLAVRVDAFIRLRNDSRTRSDIGTPSLVKLFITGYLAKDITFYSYYMANEGGEVVGFEDAFFYFNNVGGHELDIQIGQFQVMDPIFSREQRLTFQDIEIYLVQPGDSRFRLTYQRGGLLSYGIGPIETVFGLVNGNGIGLEDDDGNFDNNTPKDYFGRLGASSGPVGVGIFAYKGLETDEITDRRNSIIRYGSDVRIWMKDIDLRAQWLFGKDDNPEFLSSERWIRHSGGFIELDYHFNPDWTGVLLYNYVASDRDRDMEKNLGTMNLTHYFLRNLKGFMEYTHDFQQESSFHPDKQHSLTAGMVVAF